MKKTWFRIEEKTVEREEKKGENGALIVELGKRLKKKKTNLIVSKEITREVRL